MAIRLSWNRSADWSEAAIEALPPRDAAINAEALRPYYGDLVAKYLPPVLAW